MPTKQVVCAICVDRTRGKTQPLRLTHGVVVYLCAGHADAVFLEARGGRDKALVAHLGRLRDHTPPRRRRPGSYTWPIQRRQAERAFAGGASPRHVHERLRAAVVGAIPINPPSSRTIHR